MNPQNNPTNPTNDPAQGLSLPAVDPDQTNRPPTEPILVAPPINPPSDPSQPPAPAANPSAPATSAPQDVASPQIADDNDLIEKEWVEKAKQLVDKTKTDPYTQNKEINKFKASYIKKRYNKDIQLSKE